MITNILSSQIALQFISQSSQEQSWTLSSFSYIQFTVILLQLGPELLNRHDAKELFLVNPLPKKKKKKNKELAFYLDLSKFHPKLEIRQSFILEK